MGKTNSTASDESSQNGLYIKKLQPQLDLNKKAVTIIRELLDSFSTTSGSDMRASHLAALHLMIKLYNDISTVYILTYGGFTIQAMTIASSAFEAAYTIGFIGEDNDKANKWLAHSKEYHCPWKISHIIEEISKELSDGNIDIYPIQKRLYAQLCMAKHANPLLLVNHGYKVVSDRKVFKIGPDNNDASCCAGWMALQGSVVSAFLASMYYICHHVVEDKRDEYTLMANELIKEHIELVEKAYELWPRRV